MIDAPDAFVFACCSVGIGRWYWAAWANEDDARASAPPVAAGYEPSADRCEAKAAERLGSEPKRLPSKWASAFIKGGRSVTSIRSRTPTSADKVKPPSRWRRPVGAAKRPAAPPRLAFLYSTTEPGPTDPPGQFTVSRHRIVKQTARKIRVESEPFDEDEWARRAERGDAASTGPEPRTIPVDRTTLRTEGRFRAGGNHGGRTFYAREDDALRDVHDTLTAKHPWCAVLGIRFPCSAETVRTAYRRLARAAHPDAGGDPAQFRAVEQAYRAALAYFSPTEE